MKTAHNSTWRLHEILSQLRAASGGEATRIVFGKLFETVPADTVLLYKHVVSLVALVDETEQRISRIPAINHQLYLKSVPTIRKALAISNWDTAWQGQLNSLTETAVADIAFCADILSKDYSESPIKPDELESLKKEINELYARVVTSKINKKLRQIILDLLDQILWAISQYRIRGASVLSETLAEGLGRLILNHQIVKEETDNDELNAFLKVLARLEPGLVQSDGISTVVAKRYSNVPSGSALQLIRGTVLTPGHKPAKPRRK